jgi:hypothetical protein
MTGSRVIDALVELTRDLAPLFDRLLLIWKFTFNRNEYPR